MTIQIDKLLSESEKVLSGKSDRVKLALMCLISGGHGLIEDVPGVGKTTLVKLLSKLTGMNFGRVQFTNDLLPSDILGTSIFHKELNEFKFHKGPVFCELLLADEINRSPAKTQSALLESMEERSVTIDGNTHNLGSNFTVFATQNPTGQLGTYQLPESQLDRFMIKFDIGYADETSTVEFLKNPDLETRLETVNTVTSLNDLTNAKIEAAKVHTDDNALSYIYRLLKTSREHSEFKPLSNRSAIDIVKMAKTFAYISGKDFVTSEHIQEILAPVVGHRLTTTSVSQEWSMANKLIEMTQLRP